MSMAELQAITIKMWIQNIRYLKFQSNRAMPRSYIHALEAKGSIVVKLLCFGLNLLSCMNLCLHLEIKAAVLYLA